MNVNRFLSQNVKPVLGCTDPVSVGYGAALAYQALYNSVFPDFSGRCPKVDPCRVRRVLIKQDRDSYKNGIAIAIPGTRGEKGTALAAALGLFLDPSRAMSLFEDMSDDLIDYAKDLVNSGRVQFKKNEDSSEVASIDVSVNLEYEWDGGVRSAFARIQVKPDAVSEISVDGRMLFSRSPEQSFNDEEKIPESLKDMIEVVRNISPEEGKFLLGGIEMNRRAAEEGLKGSYGLELGKQLSSLVQKGIMSDSLISKIRIIAAAAGDARMGGANVPVMSTAGSGNQGITGLVPIEVVGEWVGAGRRQLSEAAMLVHLVTKFMLNHSSYLSAICGCAVKAGIGAAAGVAYLLGGSLAHIGNAINIMAGNITGMICDGAKAGCALKLSTASATAAESAFLALNDMRIPTDNGIIWENAEDTIRKIGEISREMVAADVKIVEIMQEKNVLNASVASGLCSASHLERL
jgi:L-cysteine desulfidase